MRLPAAIAAFLAAALAAAAPIRAEGDAAAPEIRIAPAFAGRPACAERFAPFATGAGGAFLTDGLVVLKDGETVFEHYDGVFDATKPHHLWSASKTITATLLGAAVARGLTLPDGGRLTLATRLADILGDARAPAPGDRARFEEVTLEHLVEMTAGFDWAESYEGDVADSSVLKMLYLDGRADMARYALAAPLAHRPGTRWIYSGGNANMVMAALRRAAGEGHDRLPWTLLFDPLGMGREAGIAFERDGGGAFVGSSYVHLAPRDMARLGQLWLDEGVWRGRHILPEGWMAAAREIVPAQTRLDLGPDYVAFVDFEGLYGRRGFWLNIEVDGFKVQFPNAPRDMFFAAGHYGQLIIVLPGQRMVIARTGHDQEYWSKIDEFVAGAVACFGG